MTKVTFSKIDIYDSFLIEIYYRIYETINALFKRDYSVPDYCSGTITPENYLHYNSHCLPNSKITYCNFTNISGSIIFYSRDANNIILENNIFQNLRINDYIIRFIKPKDEGRIFNFNNNIVKDSTTSFIYLETDLFDISHNSFKNLVSKIKLSLFYVSAPNKYLFFEGLGKVYIQLNYNITENIFDDIYLNEKGTPVYFFYPEVTNDNYIEPRIFNLLDKNYFQSWDIKNIKKRVQTPNYMSNPYLLNIFFGKEVYKFDSNDLVVLEKEFYIGSNFLNITLQISDIFGNFLNDIVEYNLYARLQTELGVSLSQKSNKKTTFLQLKENTFHCMLDLNIEKDMLSDDKNIRAVALTEEYSLKFSKKIRQPNIYTMSKYDSSHLTDLEYFKFKININDNLCKEGEMLNRELLLCIPCKMGLERYNKENRNCTKCEMYLNCTNPVQPIAQKGFFVSQMKNNTFYLQQCPNRNACLEGNQCRKGYKGMVCMSCDSENKYVKSGLTQCIKCPKGNLNFVLYILIFICSPILSLILVYHKFTNKSFINVSIINNN
jgi:hypothetical protein